MIVPDGASRDRVARRRSDAAIDRVPATPVPNPSASTVTGGTMAIVGRVGGSRHQSVLGRDQSAAAVGAAAAVVARQGRAAGAVAAAEGPAHDVLTR